MPGISRDFLSDLDPDINFSDSLNNDDLNSSSKYYSILDFNQLDSNQILTLSIVHLNVRTLGANFDKFQAQFASCNLVPDILRLSETWFNHDNPRDLNGYFGHHVTRPNGCGGGISTFVNDSIKSHIWSDISYNSNSIEIVSVTFKNNDSEYVILGCYRPHSGTSEEFLTN